MMPPSLGNINENAYPKRSSNELSTEHELQRKRWFLISELLASRTQQSLRNISQNKIVCVALDQGVQHASPPKRSTLDCRSKRIS